MESWVGTKTLVFYSGCNAPTFFRNLQKRSLAGGQRDALRKTLPNIVDLVLVLIIAEILHAAC